MAIRERVSAFVVDASVSAVWVFDDESNPMADVLLAELRGDSSGFVPQHWSLEMWNTLLVGARRGRIALEDIPSRMSSLGSLRLHTDAEARFEDGLYLARLYNLTMYDAMYLELALRRRLPLATLDRRLSQATSNAGVETLP